MPITRRSPLPSSAVPAIMPAWVEPVTVHTITVSKKTPSSFSCGPTSRTQLAKPSPPSGWSDAPAGIGYGLPPVGDHRVERLLPRVADADVEARGIDAQIATHDPRQLDVADDFVARIVPVDPMLLDGDDIQAQMACHAGYGACVVRLDAADADECVAALGQRVGGEVLELAHLVATKGDAAVAVLALGPDLDLATQRGESRGSG